MEAFLKTIKDRPEAQTVSSGLPHQSSDQGAAAIGSRFSNPIFFVYHGELPRLPYCNSQPNSIKLPLPWRNILSLCSRVSVPSPSDFLQDRIVSLCFVLLRLCPDNENQRRRLRLSSVCKWIWYVKTYFFVCVREWNCTGLVKIYELCCYNSSPLFFHCSSSTRPTSAWIITSLMLVWPKQ